MKKFFYAPWTKGIAVLLLVAVTLSGVYGVTDCLYALFSGDEPYIYRFEDSFDESSYMAGKLYYIEHLVVSACEGQTDTETIKDDVNERLLNVENIEDIDYHIQIDNHIFTNTSMKDPDEFKGKRFFTIYENWPDGSVHREGIAYSRGYLYTTDGVWNENKQILIYASLREPYVSDMQSLWQAQERLMYQIILRALVHVLGLLLLLSYLIAAAGKKTDGSFKNLWLDRVWTEMHLLCMGFFGFFAVYLALIAIDACLSGRLPTYLSHGIALSASGLGVLLVTAFLLSLVRKIKGRMFFKTSLSFMVLRFLWRFIKAMGRAFCFLLRRKTGAIYLAALLIYTALIGLCGIFLPESPLPLIFALILFFFVAFVLSHRAKDLEDVRAFAHRIRAGELSAAAPPIKSSDLKELKDDIGAMQEGLEASVAAKVRAERMKTELITNVSHDLKTPLTSIISYTKLLSEMENLPQQAKDYTRIIAQKSERLHRLTQDLFAVSKAQSGNETYDMALVDLSVLTAQALAEMDSEIKNSGLSFVVHTEENITMLADGKKLSRVLENLLNNAIKYTMPNTRVFVSVIKQEGAAIVEIKNTSAQPLDFDAEEITGRFVRGDRARTDGGTGLGLAIAKSYTEGMGGRFHIDIDGDLFKVRMIFPAGK